MTGPAAAGYKDRGTAVFFTPRRTAAYDFNLMIVVIGNVLAGLLGFHNQDVQDLARGLCAVRGVPAQPRAVWEAIEHDDVLAAGLARLLLYTDPARLPSLGDEEGAWQLYLRTWRPGAHSRGDAAAKASLRQKWAKNYGKALEAVQ